MATVTSNATGGNLTVSGNTQVSGTISWSKPTIPSGVTISSCVLTGTATASMSKGSATITVNGTTVTSGSNFTINLGTTNNTTSVATTAKGGNKNSNGTVSFSNLVYTVTYSIYHTVTFVDWNGTVLKTQQVEEGSSATAPNNPTRTGYRFTGWDKAFNNVTSDLTVTAQYVEAVYYTVTFKDWDGTVLKTQTVESGKSATAPSNPTREGYNFTGWDVDFSNVTSNLTVTAQYEEESEEPEEDIIEWTGIGTVATGLRAHDVEHNNYKINMDWDTQYFDIIVTEDFNYLFSDSSTHINLASLDEIIIGSNTYVPSVSVTGNNITISLYGPNNDASYSIERNYPYTIRFAKEGIYVLYGSTSNLIMERNYDLDTIYFNEDGLDNEPMASIENGDYDVAFDLVVSERPNEEPEEPDLIEPVDGYIAKNLVSYGDWSYTFNVDWDTKYLDIEVLNYEYGLFGTSYYYNINNNSYSHESVDSFTINGVEVESDQNDIDIIRYSKVDGVCIITSNGTQIIPGNSFANDNKTTVKADIITEWLKEEEDGFMTFNIKITDITPSEEPDNNELLKLGENTINILYIGNQRVIQMYLNGQQLL